MKYILGPELILVRLLLHTISAPICVQHSRNHLQVLLSEPSADMILTQNVYFEYLTLRQVGP